MLEGKSGDLEERLTRFAGVLDKSLEGAAERARSAASDPSRLASSLSLGRAARLAGRRL